MTCTKRFNPETHFSCSICHNVKLLSPQNQSVEHPGACHRCVIRSRENGYEIKESRMTPVTCPRCKQTRDVSLNYANAKAFIKLGGRCSDCATADLAIKEARTRKRPEVSPDIEEILMDGCVLRRGRLGDRCRDRRGNINFDCVHYDECLDAVVAANWDGWVWVTA